MKIKGTNGPELLEGTEANDIIRGLAAGDLLIGSNGDDRLHGGNGNDDIIGGEGFDKLWGGKGDDTFFFPATLTEGKPDRIKDFVPGEDTITVQNVPICGAAPFDDVSLSYDPKSGNVVVDADGDRHVIAKLTKGLVLDSSDLVVA